MLVPLHPKNPNPRNLKMVIDCLKDGGVIIYPTDTVYGMGCDIFHQKAVERICRIKNINPAKAQFSFICYDLSHLSDFCKSVDTPIFRLLKSSLPGPFTYILNASKMVPKLLKTKKDTVGIRVPDNLVCRTIVKELGNPVMSTSITDEYVEYFTDPELIHEKFKDLVDIVIDGGIGGMELSTVVDCTGEVPEIIRQGKGLLQEFA
jgi:tRNA threonylcarbamoyl adenosine modification protein (Sua5/YciO/YrdC/YwlC family)